MRNVVIIGASGHGKVVADIIQKSGDKVVGFLDDNTEIGNSFIGLPMLGGIENYVKYLENEFVIAIGNADIREKIARRLQNIKLYTAIHPSAVVSGIDVKIGSGTVVMANACINSSATIGQHCIINTGAVIEHDNNIEDYAHISVGAKLAGNVRVGKKTWIGIGAVVSNNISITDSCMIGAGAVVVKDIDKSGLYLGVPATKLK